MATRKERVILDLDANPYLRGLAAAGAATEGFERKLGGLDRTSIGFNKTTRTTSNSIDQLSGRLAILTRAAAALGPGLVPIATAAVPAMAGLATQLGFAAAGAGTAVLAFNGVGDALEALNEYQLDPSTENLEKLNESMRGLGPAAQEFVGFLDEIIPQLQTLRETAQEGALPGFQEGLDSLLDRLPDVRDIISEIATASGDLIAGAGAELAGSEWDQFFTFLENEARPALITLGQTAGNVARGIAELWMALDPLSDDFTSGLLRASQAFASWADNLSSTQGFQEFLAYVRETGPQVLDTIGSLANALLQIGEAAAPLGGPVLQAIEAVANAVATIADSPIGPPLMAAVAAMSALSLASKGFAAVMGGNLATNVKGLTADLKTMGSTSVVAWGRSADATMRYNEAVGRVRSTLKGVAGGAAAVGGLALASSDLGRSIGLTSTAMGAMTGSIGGPWGAAVGAGIGLSLDFAGAQRDLTSAIEAANQAAMSGNVAQMESQLANLTAQGERANKWLVALAVSGLPGARKGVEWLAGDLAEAAGAQANLTQRLQSARGALAAVQRASTGQAGAIRDSAEAIEFETRSLEANIDAMREKRQEALRAANAEIDYQAAIDDARASLKDNGRTLDITTEKGRANRRALLDIAGAWNNQSDAVKNSKGAHRDAIDTFVRVATQMGMNEKKARQYARELLEIPPNRETKIHAEAGQAFRTINGVKVALRNLDGTVSTTYIRTVRSEHMANRLERGRATGGYISGPGTATSDSIPAWLSNGEYVIKAAAVDHYGSAFFDAANSMRLASGGLVGAMRLANGGSVDRGEILRLRQEIRDLMKELAEQGKDALRGLERRRTRAELREARRDLRDTRSAPRRELLEGLRGARASFDVADILGRGEPANPTRAGIRAEVNEFRKAIRDAGGTWTKRMDRLGDKMVRNAKKIDVAERAIEKETARRDKLTEQLSTQQQAMDQLLSTMGQFSSAVAGNFLTDPFNQSRTVTTPGRVDPGLSRRLQEAEARLIGLRSSPNADSVAAAAEASVLLPQIQAMRAEVERQSQPVERAISGHQALTETLQAEAQSARDFLSVLQQLRGRGLSTDVLSGLATSGDLGTAQGLLAGGQTAIQDINRMWNERAAAAAEVAAFATQEVYGQQQAQLQAHLDRAADLVRASNERLDRLDASVDRAGDRIVRAEERTSKALTNAIQRIDKRIDNLPKKQEDNRRARGRRK